MQGVRDYIKFLKRGYGRVSQMVALDLRKGRISKERAEALVEEFEGKKPPSLKIFLDYLGLDEAEFNELVGNTVVPPNRPNFAINKWAPQTWDFERWYREPEPAEGIEGKDRP
jgi:hypothetical protein